MAVPGMDWLQTGKHPHWQGSLPCNGLELATGCMRGRGRPPDDSQGRDGAARLGLPGYMIDVAGKERQDASLVKRSDSAPCLPSWEHRSATWRNTRAVAAKPVAREPPDRYVSQRPPFLFNENKPTLLRGAAGLPPHQDMEYVKFKRSSRLKEARKERRMLAAEVRTARASVESLEEWERTHVGAAPAAPSKLLAATYASGEMGRTASQVLLPRTTPSLAPQAQLFESGRRRSSSSSFGQESWKSRVTAWSLSAKVQGMRDAPVCG